MEEETMRTKEQTIKEYITYRSIECKNHDAITNYERYIRRFLKKANNTLTNLNEAYLTAYVNKISTEFSQKSLNNIKPLFKNFIKWYFPDYSIKFRNLDKICKTKRAKASYSPNQMLTEPDIKKLISGETDLFWKCFWLVFFFGGFRGIDVVRLKWDMFSFEKDGTIIIKCFVEKNQKTFYKSLPPEITPLLKKWRGINPSVWVFPSVQGDHPINSKTPNERLSRLSKKTLGKKINPYLLRHSFASIKYNEEGGASDDVVADQMGHSKSMKETYTHFDEDKMIKRAKGIWTDKKEMPKAEKDMLTKKVNELQEQLRKVTEILINDMSGKTPEISKESEIEGLKVILSSMNEIRAS